MEYRLCTHRSSVWRSERRVDITYGYPRWWSEEQLHDLEISTPPVQITRPPLLKVKATFRYQAMTEDVDMLVRLPKMDSTWKFTLSHSLSPRIQTGSESQAQTGFLSWWDERLWTLAVPWGTCLIRKVRRSPNYLAIHPSCLLFFCR